MPFNYTNILEYTQLYQYDFITKGTLQFIENYIFCNCYLLNEEEGKVDEQVVDLQINDLIVSTELSFSHQI